MWPDLRGLSTLKKEKRETVVENMAFEQTINFLLCFKVAASPSDISVRSSN